MPQPPGWRELSKDAKEWVFWIGIGLAVLASIAAGAVTYWAYLWQTPPPVQALMGLASFGLVVVIAAYALLVGHAYLGWPKRHPFYASVSITPPQPLEVSHKTETGPQEPIISVTVRSGTRTFISVRNTGGPFLLRAIGQIVSVEGRNHVLDNPGEFVYEAREVGGGDDISQYEIAEVFSAPQVLKIYGEHRRCVQDWRLTYAEPIRLSIEFRFHKVVAGGLLNTTYKPLVHIRVNLSTDAKGGQIVAGFSKAVT